MNKKTTLLLVAGLILFIPLFVAATREITNAEDVLKRFQQIFGLVGFLLLSGQFILASRLKVIERGIGLDRLFYLHRKMGIALLAILFTHYLLFFIHTAMYPKGFWLLRASFAS